MLGDRGVGYNWFNQDWYHHGSRVYDKYMLVNDSIRGY